MDKQLFLLRLSRYFIEGNIDGRINGAPPNKALAHDPINIAVVYMCFYDPRVTSGLQTVQMDRQVKVVHPAIAIPSKPDFLMYLCRI